MWGRPLRVSQPVEEKEVETQLWIKAEALIESKVETHMNGCLFGAPGEGSQHTE